MMEDRREVANSGNGGTGDLRINSLEGAHINHVPITCESVGLVHLPVNSRLEEEGSSFRHHLRREIRMESRVSQVTEVGGLEGESFQGGGVILGDNVVRTDLNIGGNGGREVEIDTSEGGSRRELCDRPERDVGNNLTQIVGQNEIFIFGKEGPKKKRQSKLKAQVRGSVQFRSSHSQSDELLRHKVGKKRLSKDEVNGEKMETLGREAKKGCHSKRVEEAGPNQPQSDK